MLMYLEVTLQMSNLLQKLEVKIKIFGIDKRLVETYDNNPMINTITCVVKFPDGKIRQHAENVISKNMINTIDSHGYSTTVFEAKMGHNKGDSAFTLDDKYVTANNANMNLRK